jgi:hypothetical protein
LDGRELWFEREMIARPNPSFAARINHRNCSIAVELGFENPIKRVERLLDPLIDEACIGSMNWGRSFLTVTSAH